MAKRERAEDDGSFNPLPRSERTKEDNKVIAIHYRTATWEQIKAAADEKTNGNISQLVRECIRYGMKKIGVDIGNN